MIIGEGNGTPLQCSCLENPMDSSHGWKSLEGCSLWGRTESDTTKVTKQQQQQTSLEIQIVLDTILGKDDFLKKE